jgi:hypothetical protein
MSADGQHAGPASAAPAAAPAPAVDPLDFAFYERVADRTVREQLASCVSLRNRRMHQCSVEVSGALQYWLVPYLFAPLAARTST